MSLFSHYVELVESSTPHAASPDSVEVMVVGAGPAGLSAALVLARCRRRVLVADTREYRNAASRAMHGFLSREGIDPAELRRIARDQLDGYPAVRWTTSAAQDVYPVENGFQVDLTGGRRVHCRKLLLATGVVDELPDIPQVARLYGRGVFHCPYCDGHEVADQPLIAYGHGADGARLGLELTAWSGAVLVCTDGTDLDERWRRRLHANGITVDTEHITGLRGADWFEAVVFADGREHPAAALFFHTRQRERSGLAARLGCTFNDEGTVATGDNEATNVPGLFVAGDASRQAQLAIVAAGEGAEAAAAIHAALLREDLR